MPRSIARSRAIDVTIPPGFRFVALGDVLQTLADGAASVRRQGIDLPLECHDAVWGASPPHEVGDQRDGDDADADDDPDHDVVQADAVDGLCPSTSQAVAPGLVLPDRDRGLQRVDREPRASNASGRCAAAPQRPRRTPRPRGRQPDERRDHDRWSARLASPRPQSPRTARSRRSSYASYSSRSTPARPSAWIAHDPGEQHHCTAVGPSPTQSYTVLTGSDSWARASHSLPLLGGSTERIVVEALSKWTSTPGDDNEPRRLPGGHRSVDFDPVTRGPLPPHERAWRHPSELPAPPHRPRRRGSATSSSRPRPR